MIKLICNYWRLNLLAIQITNAMSSTPNITADINPALKIPCTSSQELKRINMEKIVR
ncbi:MAG TPA: hypothetical protein VK166_04245 [Chitinophagaceae bacterium]|nr:hypothetical protein [Chitinophagaceae bacterium]